MAVARTAPAGSDWSISGIRWNLASLTTLWAIDARGKAWRCGVAWPFERTVPPTVRPRQGAPAIHDIATGAWVRRPRRATGVRRLRLVRAAAGLSVLCVASACAFPYFAPDSPTDAYVQQHRLTQAVELSDARGIWLGVMPRAITAVRGPASDRPEYLAADTPVPEGWWNTLVALEDRNMGSWRSVHGIDILSLGRAVLGLSGGTDGRGGSTLTMQLVRSMRSMNPAKGSSFAKLSRKFLELRDGALLYHRLGGAEGPQFRQYVARHIPLVIGAPGSRMGTPLHGIAVTSQVLWGLPPERLTLAQNAVLAAAFWRPIILAPEGDANALAARDARWQLVVQRAIRGLELAYPGDPRMADAIAELRRMPAPRPRLERLNLTGLDAGRAFQIAANPEARATALASPELITANGEMLNRFGRDYSSRVTAIRLTLDIEANLRFRRAVQTHLASAERALAGRLLVPLRNQPGHAAGADVVIAMTRNGRIIRFFSNSQEPLFNGSLAERDEQLRFQLSRTLRPIGSIGKVMVAVRLGREDDPDSRYCNASFGTIQNADGNSGGLCNGPDDWRNARQVFARSMNLPLIWRLRNVPQAELRAMAERYRLSLPPQISPRVALPLGVATARPSDLVGAMQAIGRGARSAPAAASEPTIVAAYRVMGWADWIAPAHNPATFDFRRDFNPRVSRFVRTVLSAPAEEGGTLAGLASVLPSADLHIAKSGTSDARVSGHVRDKYAVGAIHTPSGDFAYILLVGARDPRAGLGTHISWQPFYPLLRELVSTAASQ